MPRRSNRKGHREFAAQAQDIRPGDFPIGGIESRAAARGLLQQGQTVFTVIFHVPDLPLDLESSSCERFRWPSGEVMEIVSLSGRASDLSDEQLAAFVERYPILPG